jgi:hypothetical protein
MPAIFPVFYPLVNGNRWSFASITFYANGIPIPGVTEINYGQELAPGELYGTNPQKLGETVGQLKPTASFTIYELEYYNLINALCALAASQGTGAPNSGYMQAHFDILVQKQENFGPIAQDVLRGCKFKKAERGYKSGPDGLMTKIELSLFYIQENGNIPLSVVSATNPFVIA